MIAKVEAEIAFVETRRDFFGAIPLVVGLKDGRTFMILLTLTDLARLPVVNVHNVAELCGWQLLRAIEKGEEYRGE